MGSAHKSANGLIVSWILPARSCDCVCHMLCLVWDGQVQFNNAITLHTILQWENLAAG